MCGVFSGPLTQIQPAFTQIPLCLLEEHSLSSQGVMLLCLNLHECPIITAVFKSPGKNPKKKSRLWKRTQGVHGWFGLLMSAMLNAADPMVSQPCTLIMQWVAYRSSFVLTSFCSFVVVFPFMELLLMMFEWQSVRLRIIVEYYHPLELGMTWSLQGKLPTMANYKRLSATSGVLPGNPCRPPFFFGFSPDFWKPL